MQINRGIVKGPQKVVLYGPEGIGKSSLAAMFPNAVFIDTEGSTKHMDVARTPNPSSWTMLMEQVNYFKANPTICDTLIIDTADWAERLCISDICARYNKDGIEEFGYGKGYVYLEEEFGRFLNSLSDLISRGINVVLTAHAQTRKFEQPDEMGAYDRWEFKLEKKTAPLVKEWADMVLFVNYKTFVVNSKSDGKGSNKAQGGKRVIYTTHHVCWDAKNRHGLPIELTFDSPENGYSQIARCIPPREQQVRQTNPMVNPSQEVELKLEPVDINNLPDEPVPEECQPQDLSELMEEKGEKVMYAPGIYAPPSIVQSSKEKLISQGIPKALVDLMITDEDLVTVDEIQKAVATKGYYPIDTPISNYDPNFINGVLIGAWPQVYQMIQQKRK